MRIVYLASLYPPHVVGGAEIVLQQQAEAMAARGHDVHVLTIGPAPEDSVEKSGGVTVHRVGPANVYFHHGGARPHPVLRTLWHWRDRNNAAMADSAAAMLAHIAPDVVCCHNIAGWSTAVWAAVKALDLPLVQVLHDQYLLCVKSTMFSRGKRCAGQCTSCRLLRLDTRVLSNQVDAVVGVSAYVLNMLEQAGYFSTVPIREVHYNATARAMNMQPHAGERGAELVIGFIGTLAPNKGIENFLSILQRHTGIDVQILVAGRGDAVYENYLHANFASPSVQFLGYINPDDFYSRIDLAVVPSLWNDTLPSVVFEALHAGIPVLGARRGGITEMIEPGRNGQLFEPEDAVDVIRVLHWAMDQRAQLRAMAAHCRASAARFFDMARWVNDHEHLLGRVITATRAPLRPEQELLICSEQS